MKKKKTLRSFLAVILVFAMTLGTSLPTFAAVEDHLTGNSVNYVSLGASNVNGYGLDGYLPQGVTPENKNTANVYGYEQCPEGCYVDLIHDDFESRGFAVNVDQLAISSMRAEELRILLDEDYNTFDKYSNWRFIGPGKWFDNAGGLENLRAEYKAAVENADLITVDIGVNNFGVYLSNQLSSGGTKYDDDLSIVNPELAEAYDNAKAYVYKLIEENAAEYADVIRDLDFVVDAMAYAYAGFCVNYDAIIEKIYELNPDATVVAVSIQNLMEGLEATIPGVSEPIPFGDLFGALVDAANLYVAVGSPYSAEYLFADVSEDGRVEFFLDQLLAYDGDPATLDRDMKDCFDVYDDDLLISTRINTLLAAEPGEKKDLALNVAYDVVAEIMKLGAENNVLDLATVFAGGYGAVEDGLLAAIEAEVMNAVGNVVVDPAYTYTIDEDFFSDIADTAGVPNALVNTVATLGIRTGIGNSFYGHPNREGHREIASTIIDALENDTTGLDALLERLDITEEYEDAVEVINRIEAKVRAIIDLAQNGTEAEKEAFVKEVIHMLKSELGITKEDEDAANEIIDEIKDIIDVAQNGTDAEKEALIMAYFELLKDELGITAEDEAKIAEFAAIAVEVVDIVKNTSKEDAKAVIDEYLEEVKTKFAKEFAQLGHKHYEANENSYYLAIGGDTLFGTGVPRQEKLYYDLVCDALGLEDGAVVAEKRLIPAEVETLIMSNAQDIAKADLITYQLDSSAFINSLFSGEDVDWSKYVDAKVSELFNAVIKETTEILAADWAAYANAELDEVLARVLPEVQAAVAEYVTIDIAEEKIDAIISLGISSVKSAIELVNAKKDEFYNGVIAEINGIDDMVIDFAEKIAYTAVSFTAESVKAVEIIQTINPDAALLVVGMYNPLNNLQIAFEGKTYNAGDMFEYVIDITNAFYYTYAAINGDFAFVNVSEAKTNGFTTPVEISNIETAAVDLVNLLRDADDLMHANADGHKYIKEQIVKTLTCDYSVHEQLDAENHSIKCSICDFAKTEAHSFDGDVCTKCGYTKPETPTPDPDPTPNPVPGFGGGGGGVSANEFTIKFETNGGSKIANVVVKKGDRLDKPADPTKDGYTFAGWYEDKNLTTKYDFSKEVKKSFTLYAKWEKTEAKFPFTDVDVNAWYYQYVKTVFETGLMNGISETKFAPNASLTRAMFVTILYRAAGEPGISAYSNFADVPSGQYYANAVAWASENGIVNGVSETKFDPNANITREQMAAIVYRYGMKTGLKAGSDAEITYTDNALISAYATDAAKWAYNAGVILGNADGSFAPQRTATRAEAAAIFVRLLDLMK